MFLYMQDNVLRHSGKCCATVRGMFLCGEDFDSEDDFIDFSKLTLFIGDRELEKLPSQNYSLYAVGLKRTFFRGDYDVATFGTLDFYEICRGVRI